MCNEPPKLVNTDHESQWDIRNPFRKFNFPSYLKEEFVQSTRKQQENSGTEDRGPFNNRVYTFVTVPQHFESFMGYGLLQSLDHLLVIYTFLPIRCAWTAIKVTLFCLRKVFLSPIEKSLRHPIPLLHPENRLIYSHEIRDIIRFSLLMICTIVLVKVDTSVVYHEIRTQSVIKIYIFFNLLEVADRLLSAVCQDALDDLLHTASKLRYTPFRTPSIQSTSNPTQASECAALLLRDLVFQYGFALICLFAHCFLLLCQVTTLNVAFNSQNKSLVTVFISNNFVELKGNVFRKMGKTNLFQIACADVRERFHYAVWLFIVICRNMTDTGWNWDDLWAMLCDVFYILLAEVAVDWVKHSFITKFNVIPSNVYKEYTVSIAYDLLLCRQGQNTADYFDLLSRRMGLTPIPLSCLINVMLLRTVRNANHLWFIVPFALLVLFPIKILANITLLSVAYSRVKAYIKAESAAQVTELFEKSDDAKVAEAGKSEAADQHDKKPESLPRKKADEAGTNQDIKLLPEPSVHSTPMRIFGFDQPTRDDDCFVPMVLRHRRIYSDSGFTSSPTPVPIPITDELLTGTDQTSLIQPSERSNFQVPTSDMEVSSAKPSDEFFTLVSLLTGDERNRTNGEHDGVKEIDVGSVHSEQNEPQVSIPEFLQSSDLSEDISYPHEGENKSSAVNQLRLTEFTTGGKLGLDGEEILSTNYSSSRMLRSSHSVFSNGANEPLSHVAGDSSVASLNGNTNAENRATPVMPASMILRTRCYSIDLGVLSGFRRRLPQPDTEPFMAAAPAVQPNPGSISCNVDKGSQTETFVRRRRHRTRTECSDQKLSARTFPADDLPAMWERSSRNSVVQPFDLSRLRIKQPLSDIDRYSMVEGQIS